MEHRHEYDDFELAQRSMRGHDADNVGFEGMEVKMIAVLAPPGRPGTREAGS
jgi:hypothetical protein